MGKALSNERPDKLALYVILSVASQKKYKMLFKSVSFDYKYLVEGRTGHFLIIYTLYNFYFSLSFRSQPEIQNSRFG